MRKPISPSRGYTEAVLPNGERITAPSRAGLRKRIYRRLAELDGLRDIPNFESFCDSCICAALPPERAAGECVFVEPASVPRVWRADDIIRGAESLIGWMGKGNVSQEEANRRAAICSQCVENVGLNWFCAACSNVVGRVMGIKGENATPHDALLGACNICGCSNQVAIFAPLEAHSINGLTFPSHCWRLDGQKAALPEPA